MPEDAPHEQGDDGRALFERNWATIEAVLDRLCRRHGLLGDEADSFRSYAHERLIEGDYRMLRAFSGRSSMRTFLNVALGNVYRDYRIKLWGKWRPSAAARRAGEVGVLLDTYLNRDGHPLEEAIRRVLDRGDLETDEDTVRRLAAELPRRVRPRRTRLEAARGVPAGGDAEAGLDRSEKAALQDRARVALEKALEALPEQDQLIIRLHYWEGLTVAAVARALRLPQGPLYRRIDANRERLRAALEALGIRRDDVKEIVV